MNKKPLPVTLLHREVKWGIRYLLFQLTFLGPLLSLFLSFFRVPSDGLVLDTTYFIVNFGVALWIFRNYLWNSIKHSIRHWRRLLIAAAVGFAIYYFLSRTIDMLIYWLKPEFSNLNDEGIAQYSKAHFIITMIGTVLLIPPVEEVLYRGLLFGILKTKNRMLAYGLSATIFAFIHLIAYIDAYTPTALLLSFFQYFPAGLILAGAYEFSGSILAPILIHTVVNAIAIYSVR